MKVHTYNYQGNKKRFDSCRMNRNILDMRRKPRMWLESIITGKIPNKI